VASPVIATSIYSKTNIDPTLITGADELIE